MARKWLEKGHQLHSKRIAHLRRDDFSQSEMQASSDLRRQPDLQNWRWPGNMALDEMDMRGQGAARKAHKAQTRSGRLLLRTGAG